MANDLTQSGSQPDDRTRIAPSDLQTLAEFGAALSSLTKGQVRGLADTTGVPRSTLSGWTTGKHLPNPNQIEQFRRLLAMVGVSEIDHDSWVDAVLRVRQLPGTRRDADGAPYRGLQPFEVDDAQWYFGREELIGELIEAIASAETRTSAPRIIFLIGSSGSGKSSLARAGLAARLLSQPMGIPRRVIVTRPSQTSLSDLTSDLSTRVVPEPGQRPVLIVDQTEELFAPGASTGDPNIYLGELAQTASKPGGWTVVLVVRADFYHHLLKVDRIDRALQLNQIIVKPMSTDGVVKAITEPARRAGISLDDELVKLLLRDFIPGTSLDSRSEAGNLPLLSHALFETWSTARQRTMGVKDYLALGGLQGAVEKTAESVFNELNALERNHAQELFARLVNVDAGGTVTRRYLGLADVDDGDANAGLIDVMYRFVDARLLTVDESTVSLSHEALLNAWPRLRDWVTQDRASLVADREVRDAASVWEASGRDESALLRGVRLDRVETWVAQSGAPRIGDGATTFIRSSQNLRDRELAATRRRRRRLLTATVASTVLAVVAASTAVVAVRSRNDATRQRNDAVSRRVALESRQVSKSNPSLAAQLALLGYETAHTVESRSALLDMRSLAVDRRFLGAPGSTALAVAHDGAVFASSDAKTGAVQLFRVKPDAVAERWKAASRSLSEKPGETFAAALSKDGSLLAAGGTGGSGILWRINEGDTAPTLLSEKLGEFDGGIQTITFDPTSKILLLGGPGDAVQRFDLTDPAAPKPLSSISVPGVTKSLMYSPNGRLLATGASDGVLRVFDMSDTVPALTGTLSPHAEGDQLHALAFDAGGTQLALGYRSSEIRVVKVTSGGIVEDATGPKSPFTSWVNAIAFSPDGRQLTAGSSDSSLRSWRTDDWTETRVTTLAAPLTGVAYINGGSHLLTTSFDGVTRIWPAASSPYAGPRATVFNINFGAAGKRMAVFPGRRDGTVEVWDASGLPALKPLNDRIAGAKDLQLSGAGALSPDGGLIVAGTRTGQGLAIEVGDPAAPRERPTTIVGEEGLVEGVAFSRDGKTLAISGDDSKVHLWDISDNTSPIELATMATEEFAYSVEFHPTKKLLAAGSSDNQAYLWNYDAPTSATNPVKLTGFENDTVAVAFSDDGNLLAVGGSDNYVQVWDISDPTLPKKAGVAIRGPQNPIFGLDFQPGTRLLAAASQDGTVWTWNLESPADPVKQAELKSAGGALNAIAFSPDGQFLLASGGTNRIHVWDMDLDRVSAWVCANTGDGLTPEESQLFVPDLNARQACTSGKRAVPPR
jgi:WD40 repeat protein